MGRCGDCCWYDEGGHPGVAHGVCRVNPPQVISELVSGWPHVAEGDWCGQHEPVEKAAEEKPRGRSGRQQ